jgi:hypothetical protein
MKPRKSRSTNAPQEPCLATVYLSFVKKEAHLTIAQALNEIEAVLIAAAEPRLNKNFGNVKKHTTQYVQIRDDERLGPTEPEMLRRILEQLDSK